MKISVYNMGCKVNQYECDGIINSLKSAGYEVTDKLEYADIYILNTCAVTGEAEKKSRQAIERVRKYNAAARIMVCGCASERNSGVFYEKDGVNYVSGTAGKDKIARLLGEEGVRVSELPEAYEEGLTPGGLRTRAYVKIQDGCNNFCSYCIIPYLRGRSRSRDMESAIKEIESVAAHAGEIVLTGINLTAYGADNGESLAGLLERLDGINVRIRLGSLEESVITDKLLRAASRLKHFCPHFHLSLQSGSDGVLKRMNRKYTARQYREKVQLIRSYYPLAAITTDVICGFPCETEEEHAETLAFVNDIGFSAVHVFPYSKREGTAAAKLKGLKGDVIRKRCAEVKRAAADCRKRYVASIGDKTASILAERSEGGLTEGLTEEYLRATARVSARQGEIIKIPYNEIIIELTQ